MGTVNLKTASGGSVILSPANTASDVTITVPAANATMLTTATAGVPVNGPAFSAYSSVNQSVPSTTLTKLQINTKEFDTASAYDATTNYRFTPLVAGYYQVSAASAFPTTAQTMLTTIYKNGSEFKRGNYSTGANACVSALIYMNGTTDYLEAYTYHNGASPTNQSGQAFTYFQAVMVRSA